MKARRRMSTEGIILLLVIVFVLLAVIYPAAAILIGRDKSPDGGINIDIEKTSDIKVYTDGRIVEMPLEEYLVGVVAAEMPASYDIEALRAQAVAARTYTLYKRNHGGCNAHEGADICTDSNHCQAYMTRDEMAALWGTDTEACVDKITEAVTSTSGEVMLYDGQEIQVFYHACAGGMTENCENVYSQALPYLVAVSSEGEEGYSRFYGEVTVSYDAFKSAMEDFSPGINIGDVRTCIGGIVRFDSGRIESIEIGDQTFTGREIRGIFSLNSANFTVDTNGDVTFETVGYGHGVGMSQTGANAMAQDGAGYIEILTHYYVGVTITDAS